MKYTKEILEPLTRKSECIVDIIRRLGLRESGGTHSHISRKLKEYEIDTTHFVGKSIARGRNHPNQKRGWKDILVLRSIGTRQHATYLRRSLIESGRKYVCETCGLNPMWNGKELRFQVDHKNKNWLDDRAENLQFICPNCHTQTEGYNGSKGKSSIIAGHWGK
jgi:predicted RNA-binding Zn-ribbon protein involved in translation (DUF1610 family)